jgi:hypothetical protein
VSLNSLESSRPGPGHGVFLRKTRLQANELFFSLWRSTAGGTAALWNLCYHRAAVSGPCLDMIVYVENERVSCVKSIYEEY